MKKLVFYEMEGIGDYVVVFILKGSIFIFYILGFYILGFYILGFYGLGPGFDHTMDPIYCQVPVIHRNIIRNH